MAQAVEPRQHHAGRVEDYLNDKIQTAADFDTLESLLATLQEQHQALFEQLRDTQSSLKLADEAFVAEATKAQQHAAAFETLRSDLEQRLLVATRADSVDSAHRRFEEETRELRKLDIAWNYFALLLEVHEKSTNAHQLIQTSVEDAIRLHLELSSLTENLRSLQNDADGAAPHLLDQVDDTTATLQNAIKDAVSRDVSTVLKKTLWPKPGISIPESLQGQWFTAISRLLTLQKPALEAENAEAHGVVVLFPLQVMIEPLESRFKYHFTGDRPTNRIDKPEYFLSHILELLDTYSPFVDEALQPSLIECFRGTRLALKPSYIDASSALITAVLSILRAKIFTLVPKLLDQPQLLSHFMSELMKFDATIRDEWKYTGCYGTGTGLVWEGLTSEVLEHGSWWQRWLSIEKDFALARYQSIIDDASSSTLDYDSPAPTENKPTKGAIRLRDLLETVTDRYRLLVNFGQKTNFLIEVQISILDRFHNRLHSSLEAFLSMTSSLGRTVRGASQVDSTEIQGTKGLDRLCRVYGSAAYLERTMRDWSDDVFFLELWNELQDRARESDPTQTLGGDAAGSLTIADVAAKTSNTLASADAEVESVDGQIDAGLVAGGALFDETAAAYARLRARSNTVIQDTLAGNIRAALKPYTRTNISSSSDKSGALGEVSVELNEGLETIRSQLAFLAKALGNLAFRSTIIKVSKIIDDYLFDRSVLAHRFTKETAQQAAIDFAAVDKALNQEMRAIGSTGFRLPKCNDSITLLSLDEKKAGLPQDEVDSAWDVADESTGGTLEAWDSNSPSEQNLWAVEKRLFADNESARQVLDDLDIKGLTEVEARQVLRCRVELAG